MSSFNWWIALGSIFVLGIQTSISPCPLATNIAAISFISKRIGSPREILLSGILYTLGRTTAYILLAIFLLAFTVVTGDQLTRFFQSSIHAWLGPILILIGMAFLGMFSFSFGKTDAEKMQKWTERIGLWSAFPIGVLFALAFCPTSAVTFLLMIGLSAEAKSIILLPSIYGLSTALPVIVFSLILAFQFQWLGKAFHLIGKVDWWSRTITGLSMILIGMWFVLRYNFELF